jgi:1,4-alpha-glucan branching enzyme
VQSDQLRAVIDISRSQSGGDPGRRLQPRWGRLRDESLYFFDRAVKRSNNDSLYFTDQGWAGGLVFAFPKREVRQFLIDNARSYVQEYHVDGFRYDKVTVIDRFGGWGFCQDLTDTLHFVKPDVPQITEFWNPDQSGAIRPSHEGGAASTRCGPTVSARRFGA